MTPKPKKILVGLVLLGLGFATYTSFSANQRCRVPGACSPLSTLTLLSADSCAKAGDSDLHNKHRVVFEVTMEGQEQWTAVLNNVENLQKSLGSGTEIEVVAHSKGLGMLITKDNTLSDRIKTLTESGVVFAACENTMAKKNVTKNQLVPFATTTDSGVAEVIRKQEAGWSYLKSGI